MSRASAFLRRLVGGALVAAALPRSAAATDLYRWDFDASADPAMSVDLHPGGWHFIRSIDAVEQRDGHLAFRVVGGDPYFYIDWLDIDAARWRYLVLVMKTTAGAFGQIFVAETEEDSLKFPLVADGRFHTYTIPIYRVPSWRGLVRALRIDPIDTGPARVEIDSLAVSDRPAGSYELSPAPPSRVVLSPGARAGVTLGVLNTSGEDLAPVEAAFAAAARSERGGPPSKQRASPHPGERADFRWSVDAGPAARDAVLRLRARSREEQSFAVHVDPSRPLTPFAGAPDGAHLFVATDDLPELGVEPQRFDNAVPGEIRALVLSPGAGPAATVTVELKRDSGERMTVAARLPAAAAPQRWQLPLPGTGRGWRLASASLAGEGRATAIRRPLSSLSFVVEGPPALHAALDSRLQSFTTSDGAQGFVARRGEPLALSLRLQNFGAAPVSTSARFRLIADGNAVAEERTPLEVPPDVAAAANAASLRPPETGPFTLEITEAASGFALSVPLAVVASDHTWDAVQRAEARLPAAAALAPDDRRDDGQASAASAHGGGVDVLLSELSPAVRLSTSSPRMALFGRLDDFGLGGPSHMAYAGAGGVRSVPVEPDAALPTDLAENWSLFWFNGAKGWDGLTYSSYVQKYVREPRPMSLDVPFLVVWQHKPTSLRLGARGLTAEFAGEAGTIAVMPLFGATRLAQEATLSWAEQLPDETIAAARFWSRALLAYPVEVREDFSLDHGRDRVRVRETYRFETIADDWKTAPRRAAPISPSIAVAADAGFPVRIDGEVRDTGFVTHFGPLRLVPDSDTDTYEIAGALRYVDEVPVAPASAPAVAQLRRAFAQLEAGKDLYATDVGWFGGASASLAQGFKASAVPFATPAEGELLRAVAQEQMSFFVLDDQGTYVTRLEDGRRGLPTLVDTFNHVMRWPGDDAAGSGQILCGLWEYAYQSGDWDFVRRRWERARQAMRLLSGEQTWIIASRPNSGGDTFHDVILGIAAYARMAAVLGEAREHRYASYLFAKNLLAYFNFERASLDFARAHSPWIVPLVDAPMTAWDNYAVFGPFFTPLSQDGPYGDYSGFYEHYFRIGEGKYGLPEILARVHRDLLPEHSQWIFGEVMEKQVPAICRRRDAKAQGHCYQTPIDELRAHLRARILRDRDALPAADDERATMLRTRLDALTDFEMRNLVPESIAALPPDLLQRGVDLDAVGIGFGLLMADPGEGRFGGLPVISWFGLNAPGHGGDSHVDNLLPFGVFAPDTRRGAYLARASRLNWTTRALHFDEIVGPMPE